jgi:hypothetical protein
MYWEDRQRLEKFGITNLDREELAAPEAFPPGAMSQFLDFEYDGDGEVLSIIYYADWYGIWRE